MKNKAHSIKRFVDVLSMASLSHFFVFVLYYFMPLTRSQKETIVKDLTDKFKRQKAAVFVDFAGVNNKSIVEVRKNVRNEALEYRVAKKTLLRRAVKEAGLGEFPSLEGEIGVMFGFTDVVAPSRVAYQAQKKYEHFTILGGILEGKFIGREEILALAQIPSREQLLGRIVGAINAPVQNFVYVLNGNIQGLVRIIRALSERSQA